MSEELDKEELACYIKSVENLAIELLVRKQLGLPIPDCFVEIKDGRGKPTGNFMIRIKDDRCNHSGYFGFAVRSDGATEA